MTELVQVMSSYIIVDYNKVKSEVKKSSGDFFLVIYHIFEFLQFIFLQSFSMMIFVMISMMRIRCGCGAKLRVGER